MHSMKGKGGEATLPIKPKRGWVGKRKKKYSANQSDCPSGDKTCLLHGPGHSTEECKVLKKYSDKYSTQRPHKDKEARSRGKNKRGKFIEFDGEMQEVNSMASHSDPIPSKKKVKNQPLIIRVNEPVQAHHMMNALMLLTA